MVELPVDLWAEIVAEARSAYPLEACGLLIGVEALGSIEQFAPIRNAAASATEYELDAQQYAATAAGAERCGLDLVGVMHSHPNGPLSPSPTDVERAQHPLISPTWHWVIVSLATKEPEVASYLIAEGGAVRETLTITKQ